MNGLSVTLATGNIHETMSEMLLRGDSAWGVRLAKERNDGETHWNRGL